MNSLSELNSYGETLVEFEDDRESDVLFDREEGTDLTYTSFEGTSHAAQVGIEIIDIINYQTAEISYSIDVSDLPGATVTWLSVPSGYTVTNPSTGVYTISDIRNIQEWSQIKSPRINMPNDFVGEWTYTSTITYLGTMSKSWTVTETVLDISGLQTPTTLSFRSGQLTSNGSQTTRIIDSGTIEGIVYTVTCTPSLPASIDTMLANGSPGIGGSSSFNGTTKVLTITGNITQVNNRLATMLIGIVAGEDLTFTMSYTSLASITGESDTVTQTLISNNIDYLGIVRANDTYQTNTATTIEGAPLITDLANVDGLGNYQLQITAVPNTAVADISTTYITQTVDAFNPSSDEQYGRSSISGDGNTLVIHGINPGSTGRNETDRGFIDVYIKSSGTWTRQTRLRSTNQSTEGTFGSFGSSTQLSTDGNRLLVSDQYNYTQGTDAGAFFTFVRTGTTWAQESVLYPPDQLDDFDGFGVFSASDDQTILAVAARGEDGQTSNEGAVYIYTRSGSTWTYQQTVQAPTPAQDYLFGFSVAVSPDGQMLAVSDAPSGQIKKVYVYTRSGNQFNWSQTITFSGQTSSDSFGSSLAFSNATPTRRLVITNTNGNTAQVRIYSGTTTLSLTQTISYTSLSYNPSFLSVAMTKDDRVLYIGDFSNTNVRGKIEIYRRTNTQWFLIGTLTGENDGDAYGASISITNTGDVMTTGASSYDGTYVYPGIGLPLPDGRVYVVANALSGLFGSYSPSTGSLVNGTKDQINNMLNSFNLTPATGFTDNFQLYYRLVTPGSNISRKNQFITRI
jgi:hypothetical protein